ncbi:MAG: hypothetical protein AAGE80_18585 [Pseudomonadota bacterium]
MVSKKLKYLDAMSGGSVLRYRRRWPNDICEIVPGGGFYRVHMKNKEIGSALMLAEYAQISANFDKIVGVTRKLNADLSSRSPIQRYREAALSVGEMIEGATGFDDDEQALRLLILEGLAGRKDVDEEVRDLLRDPEAKEPEPTVADGVALYRKMKVKEDRQKQNRLDRISAHLEKVWGPLDKLPLKDLRRHHGRDLLEHYIDLRKADGAPLTPETIKREIGSAQTIIRFSIVEHDLAGQVASPLDSLELPKDTVRSVDKRAPMSDEDFEKVSSKLREMNQSPELWPIWELMSLGAHAKELLYLRRCDLDIGLGALHMTRPL